MKASTILAVVATAVLSYASPVPEEQSEQSAQGGYPGGPPPPGIGGPGFGPQAAGYGGGGLCTSAQPFTGTCIGSGFPALPPPIASPIGPPPCGGPQCGGGFLPPPPPPPCGGPSCGGFIPPPPPPPFIPPPPGPGPFVPSCSNTEANACCNNSGGGGLLGALPFGGGCSDLSLFGDGECGDSQIACCATTNIGNSGFSVINIGSLCQLVTL